MRNLNTEKCNAVYELMRIMSGTKNISYAFIGDEKVNKIFGLSYNSIIEINKLSHEKQSSHEQLYWVLEFRIDSGFY